VSPTNPISPGGEVTTGEGTGNKQSVTGDKEAQMMDREVVDARRELPTQRLGYFWAGKSSGPFGAAQLQPAMVGRPVI